MATIDIGPGATDRATWESTGGYTWICLDNPANGTGTLNKIEIWASSTLGGCKIGTYYGADTSYTNRACVTIGAVTSGSKQTFTGQSLGVETGDYLSIYWDTGNMEVDSSGQGGVYYKEGDQCGTGVQTHSLGPGDAYSIYAEEVEVIVAPTVTTQAVSSIATTTATGNGNITVTGGENASAWGTCLDTSANPDTNDTVDAGSGAGGTGAFTTSIDGLTEGTHYHVRAYATNTAGTSYGADVEFTAIHTLSCSDGLKAGDTPSTIGTLNALASDGVKLGDTSSTIATLNALASDGVKLGDTSVMGLSLSLLLSDGLKLGDTSSHFLTIPLSLTDGIKLGDSTVSGLSYQVSITDGTKLGDTPSIHLTLNFTLSDGIKLGDKPSFLYKTFKKIKDFTGRVIKTFTGRDIQDFTGRDIQDFDGRDIEDDSDQFKHIK